MMYRSIISIVMLQKNWNLFIFPYINFFIGDCYSGKVSATYAKSGSSPSCKNSAGAKCGKNQDCVGDAKSNFVYKVESEYELEYLISLLSCTTASFII